MEIVYIHHNTATTDSMKVKEAFGKEHKNVLAKIDYLLKNSRDAQLNFKLSEYKDKSGKMNKYYLMNRDGFLLLLMNFSGKAVLEKQEAFIRLFNQIEKIAMEVTSPEYLEYIKHLKDVRSSFTDTVKEFVEYAFAQGSSNGKRYYKIFSTDINQLLFKQNKVDKETLGFEKSQKLEFAETLLSKLLLEEMSTNKPYKQARINAIGKLKQAMQEKSLL
jgi:Rha family phage regulatory protein